MIDKLDDKNIELGKVLFEFKQSLDIYKLIAVNSNQINTNRGKTFFAEVQRLAIVSFIICIFKVFEESKRNKLNSIPAIINFIQGNNLQPIKMQQVKDYIEKNGNTFKGGMSPCLYFRKILDTFKKENNDNFERINSFRSKHVVHSEDLRVEDKIDSLPSYDIIEKLLFFGIDFYSMISDSYLNGIVPMPLKSDKRSLVSLYNVFEDLGYEKIKANFED